MNILLLIPSTHGVGSCNTRNFHSKAHVTRSFRPWVLACRAFPQILPLSQVTAATRHGGFRFASFRRSFLPSPRFHQLSEGSVISIEGEMIESRQETRGLECFMRKASVLVGVTVQECFMYDTCYLPFVHARCALSTLHSLSHARQSQTKMMHRGRIC
jgi:hypothetical protein